MPPLHGLFIHMEDSFSLNIIRILLYYVSHVTRSGVIEGCLLLSTLFNIFLERLMRDALDDYEGGVKCGGRTITDLRFADDIDLMDHPIWMTVKKAYKS